MEICTVSKNGSKWTVYLQDGTAVFTGKTRKSCFMFAYENGLRITSYQHGEDNRK